MAVYTDRYAARTKTGTHHMECMSPFISPFVSTYCGKKNGSAELFSVEQSMQQQSIQSAIQKKSLICLDCVFFFSLFWVRVSEWVCVRTCVYVFVWAKSRICMHACVFIRTEAKVKKKHKNSYILRLKLTVYGLRNGQRKAYIPLTKSFIDKKVYESQPIE